MSDLTAPQQQRRRRIRRTILFVGLLILLVSIFTVLGVSQVMELGSAAFFFVVVAGVLVLLCFFCGLIAYARAKLLSVQSPDTDTTAPVFYFLQTIHRSVVEDPVPDEAYWLKHDGDKIYVDAKTESEQCPVCLCDMDPNATATGISACCKREIHIKCAQDYFNSIRHVKCVFCRKDIPNSEDPNTTVTTACPSPALPQESSV